MGKVIANMVGRNETGRYLDEVLERLVHQVDLVLFTDDNSNDGTADLALSKGAIVQNITMKDPEESTFAKDEHKLRSISWNLVDKHAKEGDWILAIDCDEMLYMPADDRLRRIMEMNVATVASVTFYHMWNKTHFRTDKAWRPSRSTRYFKYKKNGVFKNSKLACGSEPTYVAQDARNGRCLVNSGLVMKHLGYMRDEDKKAKYERYMKLDHGEFHALSHIESIVDPNPTLERWELGG